MGHAAAREAAHDCLDGLHLVDRHGPDLRELEQVARLERRTLVDQRRETCVVVPRSCAGRLLQRLDDCGCRRMRLAALAPFHVAGILELLGSGARECIALEIGEAGASERRRGAREAELDHVGSEPERVEELRTAVRGDVGDAHPRHRLHTPPSIALRSGACFARRRPVAAELVSGRAAASVSSEPRADRVGP